MPPAATPRHRRVARIVTLAAVGTVTLLAIPLPDPEVPARPDGGQPFAWDRDTLWKELEAAFVAARLNTCTDSVAVREAVGALPLTTVQFMSVDTAYFHPVEWVDGMPEMNWLSTGDQVRWILRDDATGAENEAIDWTVKQGSVVKLRITNVPKSFHPMQHPIHLHGQRMLVIARDGVSTSNLVWKDTVLIPVGSTVDLLIDASNPGAWMLHCHIAEHLGAGMMATMHVVP